LRHLLGDPGLLDGMQAILAEPFDRGDLRAGRERIDRQHTGACGLAVDVHRAGPAKRRPTAELGAGQPEVIAQHPQERRRCIDIDLRCRAVEKKFVGCHVEPLQP
jgi:hypothetical protein